MKSIRLTITLILTLVLVVFTTGTVLANVQADVIDPCEGDSVSGIVVAVNTETNTVTIHTGEGTLCTVTLNGSHDHPIVSLLGMYFGDLDPETIEAALNDADTGGCAIFVEDPPAEGTEPTGSWVWTTDCDQEGAENIKVIGMNADGTYIALLEDGSHIIVTIDDPDTVAYINGELEKLFVDWGLEGEGDLVQVSDQIAAYHADGMGFGVLVKLYALADETGIPVEDLIDEFRSGKGMGEIFKEYGKPSKVGVGHIRNDKEQKGNGPPLNNPDDNDNDTTDEQQNKNKTNKKPDKKDKGVCNAQSNGGKAKAKGHSNPPCPNP